MQVILLERVEKLGQMGDEVRVKDGFARNFLLPKKKALRATKANREYFQTQKAQLEAHNLERKKDADAIAKKLDGKSFVLIRQAGDRGQLYGSVSPRDIADVMEKAGFTVDRHQVPISQAIKTIGLFTIPVVLHPGSEGEHHRQCRPQRGRSGARRAAKTCWPARPKRKRQESPPKNCSRKAPAPSRKRPQKRRKARSALQRMKKAGPQDRPFSLGGHYFPGGSAWRNSTWPSLLRDMIDSLMLLPVPGALVARCQRSSGTLITSP